MQELTNDHGWSFEERLRRSSVCNLASSTTQLRIQLHANVGAVLRLRFLDMIDVHHLGDHGETALHVLL
jgi:hypothetical protein